MRKPLTFEVDSTSLIYQPVSNWLKHVEEKIGKAVADKCLEIIGPEYSTPETMVSHLPEKPDVIIAFAIQALCHV